MYTFPIDTAMAWERNPITDHNRGPVSTSYEKIMTEKRMIEGTLRRFVLAEKKTFKVDWKDLYTNSEFVVDGFWSFDEMKRFYENTPGDFVLTLTEGNGTSTSVIVVFKDFSYSITKRGTKTDLCDLSVTLEEV